MQPRCDFFFLNPSNPELLNGSAKRRVNNVNLQQQVKCPYGMNHSYKEAGNDITKSHRTKSIPNNAKK